MLRASIIVPALALACTDVIPPTDGTIVTASPIATEVGQNILSRGGNAVDAAVAAAFALAVVEPTMSGIGGRTQMLIRNADGSIVGFDGGTEVPRLIPETIEVDETAGGYAAIGIPGTVSALVTAAREHGTLPLAQLVQPAIDLAERGFPLSNSEAQLMAEVATPLRAFAGSREHFLKLDGTAYSPGETFLQPALARVLRAIAESGEDVFYRGWIADSIAADMTREGGFVTADDLANYSVKPSLVVRGSYRGFDLVGTYLPASGATTIEALQILEQFDLAEIAGTPNWMFLVARALLVSFEDRVADFGAPTEHATQITSKEHAAMRAAEIDIPAGLSVADAMHAREPPFTTHVSVADTHGGMVALTQSVGPNMGSKVVTRGLGFVYAATMGYLADENPGDRPFSSQSPIFVMRHDEPFMVLGASGARRIISTLVASISRMVDGGMTLPNALTSPRFHPSGNTLYVEAHDQISWNLDDVSDANVFDFNLIARDEASYFAAVQAIAIDSVTGQMIGVAEPRRAEPASPN